MQPHQHPPPITLRPSSGIHPACSEIGSLCHISDLCIPVKSYESATSLGQDLITMGNHTIVWRSRGFEDVSHVKKRILKTCLQDVFFLFCSFFKNVLFFSFSWMFELRSEECWSRVLDLYLHAVPPPPPCCKGGDEGREQLSTVIRISCVEFVLNFVWKTYWKWRMQ